MIKQELQAIADGVAASVLHSVKSNPEISVLEKNESLSLSNKDMELQKSDLEMKHKANVEVLRFLTLYIFFVCMHVLFFFSWFPFPYFYLPLIGTLDQLFLAL